MGCALLAFYVGKLIGSMQRASSWAGEFTQVETGTASSSSAFGAVRSSADGSPGESQASKSFGSRMSGMRSWMGRTSSLAAVVMMVKVSRGFCVLTRPLL
jgi:hypothetical protein